MFTTDESDEVNKHSPKKRIVNNIKKHTANPKKLHYQKATSYLTIEHRLNNMQPKRRVAAIAAPTITQQILQQLLTYKTTMQQLTRILLYKPQPTQQPNKPQHTTKTKKPTQNTMEKTHPRYKHTATTNKKTL